MNNTKQKLQYKRMFENKGHRPWWSIPHLAILGGPLRELTGFGYKNTIYIVNSGLSNSAYFEVNEMLESTKHFDNLYRSRTKTKKLIDEVKERFSKTRKCEQWAWTQNWSTQPIEQILQNLDHVYEVLWRVFPCMFISQPQHVTSLEKRINDLIGNKQNASEILREATYYKGEMPWTKEKTEIEKYHHKYDSLSGSEQREILKKLVSSYGWLNNIEGDTSFDVKHYEKELREFTKEVEYHPTGIELHPKIKTLGALIGELGFLRFWSRWHFMHLRYHIKMILREIVQRTGMPDLEYATLNEVKLFLKKQNIDLNEIKNRKSGYTSVLVHDETKIITGELQKKYIKLCVEITQDTEEIKGSIANKGNARGKVRIVSFSATDYNQQVASFEKGEILVTGMTRPQIVHLCKKAAAIVTDEGGITSHAAVISREFGIPCIIATHNATRILKTGDLVEVDADHGVVKKIN